MASKTGLLYTKLVQLHCGLKGRVHCKL